MVKQIGLVIWNLSGGLRSVISRVKKGLENKGFAVKAYYHTHGFTASLLSDLIRLRELMQDHPVLYTGSIPLLSSIVRRLGGFINILFLHGFIREEKTSILEETALQKPALFYGETLQLIIYEMMKKAGAIQKYVCHSLITCEVNMVEEERQIILPQFLLEEEKALFDQFRRRFDEDVRERLTVVVYTSHALSPRLMNDQLILAIMNRVSKRLGKKLRIIMINPRGHKKAINTNNLIIDVTSVLPRNEFYKTLLRSSIFLETSVDEEISYSSIEAAALGTPVAKLTVMSRAMYCDYCDYILNAYRVNELVTALTTYFQNEEYYRELYGKEVSQFVWTRRVWDAVSGPLLSVLSRA